MITISLLNKQYGKKKVLENIHLRFEKGRIYGVVGENGAGKTTLFRCISGLEGYEGTIDSDYPDLKNHIGLLLTEPFFFSKITGEEYIRLLCHARGLDRQSLEEKNIFDLPLNQYASTYSTGMKKKLALMAILLQKNDIFILDEPFNGVDIQSNIVITDMIQSLKSLDKTIILSSHIFSTLKESCDEIFMLKEGKVVYSATRQSFDKLELEMKKVSLNKKMNIADW